MKIIVNETGKSYELTMTTWDGDWNGPDESEEIVLDDSFHWDDEAEAYRMDGSLDDLEKYLKEWENYETETDLGTCDDDRLAQLKEDHPRYYSLEEIN